MSDWIKYRKACFEKKCNSIQEIIKTIDEVYKLDNKIIFRGHSNEKDFKLISSLDREYNTFLENVKLTIQIKAPEKTVNVDRNDFIKMHLQRFRKMIRGKINSEECFNKEELAWTLGQHYGLFTPFLDWTEKPYIALFFASLNENKQYNKNACVYCLDTELINTINDSLQKSEQLQFSNPLTNLNPRLTAQSGCFTQAPNGISIDDWLQQFDKYADIQVLRKIIIPVNLKPDIIKFLDKANINYSTIYPDLKGISDYCNFCTKDIEKDTLELLNREFYYFFFDEN